MPRMHAQEHTHARDTQASPGNGRNNHRARKRGTCAAAVAAAAAAAAVVAAADGIHCIIKAERAN